MQFLRHWVQTTAAPFLRAGIIDAPMLMLHAPVIVPSFSMAPVCRSTVAAEHVVEHTVVARGDMLYLGQLSEHSRSAEICEKSLNICKFL